MSLPRWLLAWAALGLSIPGIILLIYPPKTDAALNATSSHLLWPSSIMLMAADIYTPPSGVALVIAMSVAANSLAYLSIALIVWIAAHSMRARRQS